MKIEFNPDGSIKLPEPWIKRKEADGIQSTHDSLISEYWEELGLNICQFFKEMNYLGFLESKRNSYYLYKKEDLYLVSTSLKPLVRFNFVFQEELDEISKIINQKNLAYFSAEDLKKVLENEQTLSRRINIYKNYPSAKSEISELYAICLLTCYTLCVLKKLTLHKEGKGIFFNLNKNPNYNLEQKQNIFSNIVLMKEHTDMKIIKNDRFYFTIKCRNFRGSIYPYIIEEIERIICMIEEYKNNTHLDVKGIMKRMEYEKRYNMVYQHIVEKNIQNERDKFDYFISRVKSALKIIASITNLIEIEKEGRGNIYLRVIK